MGRCTTDALQIQRRVNSRSQIFLTQGLLSHLSLGTYQTYLGVYSANLLLGGDNLSETCQIFSQSLATSCDPKGRQAQAGSTSWVSSSVREARTNVLLPTQLKVPPERLALSSASINEWQRSSSHAYQVSSGVSHGSQGTTQTDFLSRKNKERRHGTCPVSP